MNFTFAKSLSLVWLASLLLFASGVVAQDDNKEGTENPKYSGEQFLNAARDGDLDTVTRALKSGVDVNVASQYGATALFFACDHGHEKIVELLLENGADPNVKDTFYKATPVTWAMQGGNENIIVNLLQHGGKGADGILLRAVAQGKVDFAKRLVETEKVSNEGLIKARDAIAKIDQPEKRVKLLAIFEPLNLPETKKKPVVKLSEEILSRYPGNYKGESFDAEVKLANGQLSLGFAGNAGMKLVPKSEKVFSLASNEVHFKLDGQAVTGMVVKSGENELAFKFAGKPGSKTAAGKTAAGGETDKAKAAVAENDSDGDNESEAVAWQASAEDLAVSSANWPGFRGNGSRGVADGQNPPIRWHLAADSDTSESGADGKQQKTNQNILWKQTVPGLGLACPVIWGDRIYLTSAVAEGDEGGLKIGLYGDVASVEEDKEYEFKVFCFSKSEGKLLWEQTTIKAKPAVKRHAKSSYANPTVATNGKQVVAFFGSEGLYCYSAEGELAWKKDFGVLDSGWFYDASYQWGFASSPVIHQGRVMVQCDVQGQSFVAALDLKTGDELWRTKRDEIPTWSTPTVHTFGETTMLITNGTKAARAYDVADGRLIWSLKGHSEIVVPTPSVAHNKIYISSGYSPIQPIYAISPEANGDISLGKNAKTNEYVQWSVKRGGPYMPSPIVYGDYLYCCANNGILTCYDANTGEIQYKKRMKASGGSLAFSASPLAADGHLYFTAEDGRVLVVRAGSKYKLVEVNELNESILATPAISEGAIYLRTQNSLIAVGGDK